MEQHTSQYNFLYSCTGNTEKEHDPFVYEHALGFLISGSMEIHTPQGVVEVFAGTIALARKNQLIKAIKKPDGNKPFISISIFLPTEILKEYSIQHSVHANGMYAGEPNLTLENDDFLKGYFDSLMPYFAQPEKLTPILAQAKTTEAIALLLRNPALKNFLFDFSEPHKVDLEAFMNKHFSYNVPLTQFAKLTGRSLSTFKRDFAKLYGTTPEKWLQKRKLEQAHFLISQKNRKPSDVYLELGFATLSHFSYAFKKEFGVNASTI